MFTAKWEQAANAAKLLLSRRIDHSTNGGSSETEAKEFEVRPKRSPSTDVAITVTPVANSARLRRKPSASMRGSPLSTGDLIDDFCSAAWPITSPASIPRHKPLLLSNRRYTDLDAPAQRLIIGGRFDPFGKTPPQFTQQPLRRRSRRLLDLMDGIERKPQWLAGVRREFQFRQLAGVEIALSKMRRHGAPAEAVADEIKATELIDEGPRTRPHHHAAIALGTVDHGQLNMLFQHGLRDQSLDLRQGMPG